MLPTPGTASQPTWFARAEAGRAEIHRAASTGPIIGVRVGRAIGTPRAFRADAGLSYSMADEGYLSLDLGLEARAMPAGAFSPVLGLGAGLLAEPEFLGEIVRGYVAVELRLSRRTTLRLGAQMGQHGGEKGPNVVYGGLEFGWK